MSSDGEPQWLSTVKKKRELQASAIAPFRDIDLPANSDVITSIDEVSELAKLIAEGRYKAYEVALAYIKRAIAAHDKTNCLTEILFQNALEQATLLDTHLAQHGKPIGPLHGVPMTVKDQFNVQGYDSTLGYVGRAFQPAKKDADLVQILKNAGVVFIAKTNLPQSIMWCECENPLWGLTTHPRNSKFTPGGSTGGEGALLASKGSLFGWGTDLGGSIRIPAHMNGLYGFKPSSGRFPYEGVPVSTEGQEHVPSSVGPMARSLPSIHAISKLIIDAEPWRADPRASPIPWRQNEYQAVQSRPLVIGLLLDDGVVKVHPPIERMVKTAAKKLEQAGHKIVPWTAEGHAEAIEIMDLYFTADGGEDIKRDVASAGEPFVPHVQALVSRAPAISVWEYWQLNRRKREAQRAYLKKWQSTRHLETNEEVDIVLSAAMSHPALPHRACKWVGYTKIWNLLDYPALVMPVGQVDKGTDPGKDDNSVRSYAPRNDIDRWNWELYDPVSQHGMPLSIQIAGRRLEEEKVLGAARVIESVLSGL